MICSTLCFNLIFSSFLSSTEIFRISLNKLYISITNCVYIHISVDQTFTEVLSSLHLCRTLWAWVFGYTQQCSGFYGSMFRDYSWSTWGGGTIPKKSNPGPACARKVLYQLYCFSRPLEAILQQSVLNDQDHFFITTQMILLILIQKLLQNVDKCYYSFAQMEEVIFYSVHFLPQIYFFLFFYFFSLFSFFMYFFQTNIFLKQNSIFEMSESRGCSRELRQSSLAVHRKHGTSFFSLSGPMTDVKTDF